MLSASKNPIMLSCIFDYLERKGCYRKGEHIIIEGTPVQFIPVDKIEEEAVKDAKEIEYEGVKTKVLAPEYLIASLLRAGRKKDIEKVEKLLEQTEIDREKLKDILRRYHLTRKFKFLWKRITMPNKKAKEMRIIMNGNRLTTRKELFEKKEEFHREQAKLSFEEKIKILVKLQKIADSIKASRGKMI